MEFPENFIKKIEMYTNQPWFNDVCESLNIYTSDIPDDEKIKQIKQYIMNVLMGKFHLESSIQKFTDSMEIYKIGEDFARKDKGFIDSNTILPINSLIKNTGLKTMYKILGPDRASYIMKQTEAFKGAVSGKKNGKDALYNPIIASAVFQYLEADVAEYLLAYDTPPYYYILSKNFLQDNQDLFPLNDEEFIDNTLQADRETNSIMHDKILQTIEDSIRHNYSSTITEPQLSNLCNKIRLQYATQESIKKLIKAMDENLGNTSITVTKSENGEISDINISPAYDLDFSFQLAEEFLDNDYSNQIFHRTTKDGKTDLFSIMQEFSNIPGYKEQMQDIRNKLQDNYIDNIFTIAYSKSKLEVLQEQRIKR